MSSTPSACFDILQTLKVCLLIFLSVFPVCTPTCLSVGVARGTWRQTKSALVSSGIIPSVQRLVWILLLHHGISARSTSVRMQLSGDLHEKHWSHRWFHQPLQDPRVLDRPETGSTLCLSGTHHTKGKLSANTPCSQIPLGQPAITCLH